MRTPPPPSFLVYPFPPYPSLSVKKKKKSLRMMIPRSLSDAMHFSAVFAARANFYAMEFVGFPSAVFSVLMA